MRYPVAETAEKHARILEQAARLFRERGFAGVSLGEIMKATGLTHGPFYNHFPSKEALMAESVAQASAQALAGLERAAPDEAGKMAYLRGYLGQAHRDTPGAGCVIAALAPEIGREPGVRAAFTAHVKTTVDKMLARFPWPSKRDARSEAIRALCTISGAVALARAVDDEALSDEILQAALAGFAAPSTPRG
jgi:TetR/AcrR family transcriptional repressor of nem operon